MAIFLGIDGGGSRTTCVIGDENAVLGTGSGGPSNVVRCGEAQARESLARALREACMVASLKPERISRSCVGLAGAGRPEISGLARQIISELVPGEIEIVGDMVIALQAAVGGGPGVIVIAGTGSIAYGRGRDGRIARAGGWGFAVSDEGSGHWIGRTALAAALRAQDENQNEDKGEGQNHDGSESQNEDQAQSSDVNSPLLQGLMKAWQLGTREQLVLAASASPAPDFAALSPCVMALADTGDRDARDVLAQAGVELAKLAGIVIRRLFPEHAAVPVAMCGGVFHHSALVRQAFYNDLCSAHPHAILNPGVIEPVRGALQLARLAAAKQQPQF